MHACTSTEEVKDLVVLEQLVNTLPEEVCVWVRKRKPKTSTEAGELADDYQQARKREDGGRAQMNRKETQGDRKQIRCHNCKKLGHIAKDCRGGTRPESSTSTDRPKRDLSAVECFNCRQNCPHNALYCREKGEGTQCYSKKASRNPEAWNH